MRSLAKLGRPTKYKEEYIEELLKYFDIDPTIEKTKTISTKNGTEISEPIEWSATLPTIEGFCREIKINKDTFYNWVKEYKDFNDAYKRARDMQSYIFQTNALKGLYNPSFSIFWAKNCMSWVDRQEVETKNTNNNINTNVDSMTIEEKESELKRLREKYKDL